jgi:hypothetical protein
MIEAATAFSNGKIKYGFLQLVRKVNKIHLLIKINVH